MRQLRLVLLVATTLLAAALMFVPIGSDSTVEASCGPGGTSCERTHYWSVGSLALGLHITPMFVACVLAALTGVAALGALRNRDAGYRGVAKHRVDAPR